MTRRYRAVYTTLLRLYPRRHRERFGEGMSQTFNDLLRERTAAGDSCSALALKLFAETAVSIFRARLGDIMQNTPGRRPAIVMGFLLLIPLVMSFLDRHKPAGDGWHWGPLDFVVMGALLFGAGLGYELLARRMRTSAQKFAAGATVAFAVFVVWVELAVDGVSRAVGVLAG